MGLKQGRGKAHPIESGPEFVSGPGVIALSAGAFRAYGPAAKDDFKTGL